MRIGISVNPLYQADGSQKSHDGLGSFTKMLMHGLSESHHIEKCVVRTPSQTLRHWANPKSFQNHQLNILPHPLFQILSPTTMPSYRTLESKIDLFHSTDYLTPKFKRIPVVSTIQDAIMFQSEFVKQNLKFKLGCHALKLLAQHADHVISPSQAVIPDLVEKFGIPLHKISVVPNGIDPAWLTSSYEKIDIIKTLYCIQKPYFLVVGTLQPRKNIARILKAYQTSSESFRKHYTVLFVGNRGWLDSSTFELLEKMQNNREIQWLQHIPFEHLKCLYHHAESILFPSLAEGFGYPILEGFASGTPVITSNRGSMSEIAGDCAILIDPTSVESIQQGMEKIVSNIENTRRLVRKGYEKLGLYSSENCVTKTLETYKKVL